jgi:hypothetical protein
VHQLTAILAKGLSALGLNVEQEHFFDTLTLDTGAHTAALHDKAHARQINLRVIDAERLGLSLDETTTQADVETLWACSPTAKPCRTSPPWPLPLQHASAALLRQSPILSHPVFNRYHSETELMRYLRKLADKDLALDPHHDPAGLVHHEAQRRQRNDPGDLGRVRRPAPVRPGRAKRRLPATDRRTGSHALRRHRLRRDVAAAERRFPGRIRGPAGDSPTTRAVAKPAATSA